jgi:gliding motility-associated lipoprotein GldH
MQKTAFYIFIFITVLFSSCNSNRYYEQYYSAGSKGWHKDSVANFSFEIDNTSQNFDIVINTRNLEGYAYSNLWLFVDVVAPDSTIISDTIECELAYPNGKWMGKGTGGVYLCEFDYRSNIFFPIVGKYQIHIAHGMRDTVLANYKDIGLLIESR